MICERMPEGWMLSLVKGVTGLLTAGSLIFSSSAAVASEPPRQLDPWAVLAAMSGGAPAAAMCGAAASTAAAQASPGGCVLPVLDEAPVATVPPASAPVPLQAAPLVFAPLFLALGSVAAGVGAFLATQNLRQPNSPA
jgi:hypothetical protein